MFKKILIANRGDKWWAATLAAQPQRMVRTAQQQEIVRAAHAGDLTAGTRHV